MKHKSTEDKIRCEKVFEVIEALDSENSRASSSKVRGNNEDSRSKGTLNILRLLVFVSLLPSNPTTKHK